MDMTYNRIPETVNHIHMIAVCGTGMGALACILKKMGYKVTGSDHQVYPPMSIFLEQKGIDIFNGFDAKNLSSEPDLVIVGNAVTQKNPEAEQMVKKKLCFCSMPQAINHFMAKDKKALVICGTHGKTTTSAILAWILYRAGKDPSFVIGGILRDFHSNSRLGKGEYIVLEGDEYDTAFFDKGPKFLHYKSHRTILTSIEFDHADIFNDLNHVKNTFSSMISGLDKTSSLFAFDKDENIDQILDKCSCNTVRYGQAQNSGSSGWKLANVVIDGVWTIFDVLKHGRQYHRFKTHMMGIHNMVNALSAIAVADSLDIPKEAISVALESFQGVKRRQEIRGIKNKITVMDDFAHHPTAVRETINAVRPYYPDSGLWAIFEPRTNSSMRKIFQDIYPDCFDAADFICIRTPSRLDKIPETERFSSEKLVADLEKRGKAAFHFEKTDSIIKFVKDKIMPGDVLLIMSNGGFDNIHERLLRII